MSLLTRILIMLLLPKTLSLCCLLSIVSVNSAVFAQTSSDNLEAENVTLTGESLQGLSSENLETDYGYQDTSEIEVTLEQQEEEQTGTGNQLVDTLINNATGVSSPIYTIDKINTNQGDNSSSSGTFPFANF